LIDNVPYSNERFDSNIQGLIGYNQTTVFYGDFMSISTLPLIPLTPQQHIVSVTTNGRGLWTVTVTEIIGLSSILTGGTGNWVKTLTIPPPISENYQTIGSIVFAMNNFFAMTINGIYSSSDGINWQMLNTSFQVDALAPASVANDKLFVFDIDNELWHLYQGNNIWIPLSLPYSYQIIFVDEVKLYCLLEGPSLYVSTDGISWSKGSSFGDNIEPIIPTGIATDGKNWVVSGSYDSFGSNFLFHNK